MVNLLADTLHPIPFRLHGSSALADSYLLHLPPPPRPPLKMGLLLSQALSKRLAAGNLPKGLKATKLAATDLKRIKDFWLKREVRSDASWEQFLKTYDTTRVFSVDATSKGVELPLSVKSKASESVLLLMSAGKLASAAGPLAKLTLMQTTANRSLVGGSTFVLKTARSG